MLVFQQQVAMIKHPSCGVRLRFRRYIYGSKELEKCVCYDRRLILRPELLSAHSTLIHLGTIPQLFGHPPSS